MCQLNGENGGKLESSVDFGKIEIVNDDNSVTYIPRLLKDIIRDIVHVYGKEPYHNIIINDLDISGL